MSKEQPFQFDRDPELICACRRIWIASFVAVLVAAAFLLKECHLFP